MKTEVTVLPGDQQTTVTVLEGKALEQKPPNSVRIDGDINTVAAYIKKRRMSLATEDKGDTHVLSTGNYQLIDIDRSVITVDKFGQTITLQVDPQDHYGVVVTGKLEESDELKPFQINRSKEFKKDEFVKLLRFSRIFFNDREKYEELLKAYQTFSAKAYIDMQQGKDTRGNVNNTFNKMVETNIPTEFILDIPIFKGQPNELIRVEIGLNVTEGGATFWFESVELNEIIQVRVQEIFEQQLAGCEDFVVIYK